MTSPPPGAGYFDEWYANMPASERHAAIQQGALGLPPELLSTSLLPWDGIAEVVDALRIGPGDTLVDLACGRGGYGLEIARRTGAALVGVDFSAVAIEAARDLRAKAWADVVAEHRVGDLTATGLPDASADAVLCVDAMQFADPYPAGLAECLRVLRPGAGLVLTGWVPVTPDDERVPPRIRRDVAALVRAAGFVDVEDRDMTAWRAMERDMWERAVATDPAGDPAMQSMHDEGVRSLAMFDRLRRALVTARRPG